MATQRDQKPIHSIIIDTGPLIRNTVSISTIINSAEVLYTTPAIIGELRDSVTRSRVETTLLPFLNVKTPTPASYEAVSDFAKKTGDFAVLSRQDLGILALAYEVHCEKEGGSWGLRSVPNGPVKLRPEEQKNVDEENAKKETGDAKKKAKEAAIQRSKEERKLKTAKRKEKRDAESKKEGRSRKKSEQETQPGVESFAAANEEPKSTEEPVKEAPAAKAAEQDTQPAVKLSTAATEETKPAEEPANVETVEPKPAEEPVEKDAQSQAQPSEEIPAEPTAESQEPTDGGITIEQDGEPATSEEPFKQVGAPKKQKKKQLNSKKKRRLRENAAKEALANTPASEEQPVQESPETTAADVQEAVANVELSDPSLATQEPEQQVPKKKVHRAKARLARRAAERDALASSVTQQPTPPTSDDESDGGEWITPGNLAAHKTKDTSDAPLRQDDPQLPVATMTTDYAMQNVLLQMNMHLLSPAMQRIRNIRSTILRCHACFLTTREMDKQFCPRCGQPTLRRVTCSTDADGAFHIHLSTKYQHNKRGDKYSIPKPVAGTSNGKMRGAGGGKGGWGRELVLSEDQKEYQKLVGEQKRSRAKDPMDMDFLPGILTGERTAGEQKVKVGAGRNVNSRKRM